MSARKIKADILRFVEHLLAKGLAGPRTVKSIYHLIVLARVTDKPFENMLRRNVERLVSWINASDYSENTSVTTRSFFQ